MAKREAEGVGGKILHNLTNSIARALILKGSSRIKSCCIAAVLKLMHGLGHYIGGEMFCSTGIVARNINQGPITRESPFTRML